MRLIERLLLISFLLLLAACGPLIGEQTPATVVEPTQTVEVDVTDVASAPAPTASPIAVTSTADTEGQQAVGPEASALFIPSSCLPEQQALVPYVNYTGGYCLQYPASFRVGDVIPEGAPNAEDILGIYGPPQDASVEPLQAGLNILVVGPAKDHTLQQVVDQAILAAGSGPETTTRPIELGGEPAVIIEGLQGRSPYRELLTIHEGKVYELSVYPTGDDYPEVVADVELVWQTVLDTFTFLAEGVLVLFDACPQQAAPYANLAVGYCLRYPSSFNLHQTADSSALTVSASALLGEDPESSGARLTIERVAVTEDRTLQALANESIANSPGGAVQQSEATLDGEAALVIEGLSGGKRQFLAIHSDSLYRLTLIPPASSVPEVAASAEQLWDAVTDSFTFLPKLG